MTSEYDDFSVGASREFSPESVVLALNKHDEIIRKVPGRKADPRLFKSLLLSDDRGGVFFRRAESGDDISSVYWLSEVKSVAEQYSLIKGVPEFNGISSETLREIAKLSWDADGLKEIPKALLELGVVLITSPQIKGMKLDGAVFKLDSGTPVIGMTLRYARLDNFWFTLLHELAHICLHWDSIDEPILDDLDERASTLIERQADRLAKESFVSRADWRNCPPKYDLRDSVLLAFSKEQEIHPAIIAGLLRYELNRYDLFSKIVNSVNTREIFFGHD